MASWDNEGYWNTVAGMRGWKEVAEEAKSAGQTIEAWLLAAEIEAMAAAGMKGRPSEWPSLRAEAIAYVEKKIG